jgi:hypothetical protein
MTAYPRLTAALKHLLAGTALACTLCAALPGQAQAINDDSVLRRMDAVLDENARLRDEAVKARGHGREASKQAEAALDASDERVEKTRVEALAHVAGVSQAQVEGLRKEGRSWGQAAGDLGVHPGFLGVGKTPLYASLPKHKAKAEAAQPKGKRGKKGKAEVAERKVEKKAGGKKAKSVAKTQANAQAEPQKKHKKSKKKD